MPSLPRRTGRLGKAATLRLSTACPPHRQSSKRLVPALGVCLPTTLHYIGRTPARLLVTQQALITLVNGCRRWCFLSFLVVALLLALLLVGWHSSKPRLIDDSIVWIQNILSRSQVGCWHKPGNHRYNGCKPIRRRPNPSQYAILDTRREREREREQRGKSYRTHKIKGITR